MSEFNNGQLVQCINPGYRALLTRGARYRIQPKGVSRYSGRITIINDVSNEAEYAGWRFKPVHVAPATNEDVPAEKEKPTTPGLGFTLKVQYTDASADDVAANMRGLSSLASLHGKITRSINYNEGE